MSFYTGDMGDSFAAKGFAALSIRLAHQERNEVRAAYNRAQRLDERRKMMQAWADYLDGLRLGGNVVPFRAAS